MTEQKLIEKLLKKYSTRELGEKLGINASNVSRIATGKQEIRGPLRKMIRIIAAMEEMD